MFDFIKEWRRRREHKKWREQQKDNCFCSVCGNTDYHPPGTLPLNFGKRACSRCGSIQKWEYLPEGT